jgi:predicted acylesterase/phospholipase RssA
MMVHRRGQLWRYVRASCSIPAVFPPVLDNNDLLVDGMLLNNLPVDVMSTLCNGPVIAIDVSAKEDSAKSYNFGASLSASEVMKARLSRSNDKIVAPSILEVVMRTTEIASIYSRKRQAEQATVYVSPAVTHIGVFEVSAMDELVRIGYESTLPKVKDWLFRTWQD